MDEISYFDDHYGEVCLPEWIGEFLETPTMQRLKGLSMDTLPPELSVYGKQASRFEHCRGVCMLAHVVLKNNRSIGNLRYILPIAALFHDAGNPAFSHLGESWLRQLNGHDGESFLRVMLENSEAARLMYKFRVTPDALTAFVMGKAHHSEVLNGSLDIDNIDNVSRFLKKAVGIGSYDGVDLASAFTFLAEWDRWALKDGYQETVLRWQEARHTVYGLVYAEERFSGINMVYRALQFAFDQGKLTTDFFRLTDSEALEYLATHCGDKARHLISELRSGNRYKAVVSIQADSPSELFRIQAKNRTRDARKELADTVCKQFNLAARDVCTYIGQGRDRRKVTLPFIEGTDCSLESDNDPQPIYRAMIFVNPAALKDTPDFEDTLREFIGMPA